MRLRSQTLTFFLFFWCLRLFNQIFQKRQNGASSFNIKSNGNLYFANNRFPPYSVNFITKCSIGIKIVNHPLWNCLPLGKKSEL